MIRLRPYKKVYFGNDEHSLNKQLVKTNLFTLNNQGLDTWVCEVIMSLSRL